MGNLTATTYPLTDFTVGEVTANDWGFMEVSNLTDIDTALANKIVYVIERMHVSDTSSKRNKRLAEFIARPMFEKVAMGEFESPVRFLQALSKQGVSKLLFPHIYITRAPGIEWADSSEYPDKQGVSELYSADDEYLGDIDQSVASLTYMVNICGWQEDNIETIALYLMTWLRNNRANHAIEAASTLGGGPVTLQGEIIDRHSISAVSESIPFEENRLRVLSLTMTVLGEVLVIRFGDRTFSSVQGQSSISRGQ